ncbi:bifunctional glycosyltransferase 87/phosphatase PAP2 family protein [Streptomyces sp. NPDC049555]|uniref:bifunctional glycosyltransferase 87/phosphatase PAP2 family protein n=1 Tax=Streptomyces sp. NPDC049555 TaxID=3154930 RepID=UPI0034494337
MADAQRRAVSRVGVVLGALCLVAGLPFVRRAVAVLFHGKGALHGGDHLIGTPFAGLVLGPLEGTPGALLPAVAVALVAARAVPGPVGPRLQPVLAPLAVVLTVASLPVRHGFVLGQSGIVPVLLVLLGCCPPCGRASGVLTGLAAALQPAALLFAPLLWLTGRRRAAVGTGVVFAVCTALAWAALPEASWTYWVHGAHRIAGAGPGGAAAASLHALLLRAGLRGPAELGLYGLVGTVVVVVALRRAARYAGDGQVLLATAVTGCAALAVSPIAWPHQQLWILLAAVGRVGRRRADRPAWPVLAVLVTTLPSVVLVPPNPVLGPVGRHAPLLAALVTACVVPFLSRSCAEWDAPAPTPVAEPQRGRSTWVPLLRFFKRALDRPNLLLELMLIRVGYWVYSYIRAQAPDSRGTAEYHGRQILRVEEFVHLDVEHAFNHFVAGRGGLADAMDYYYGTFHFLVPMCLLGYLYWRRPATYRWARTALALATLLALAGFWLYPLAPPRLMPGLGFVDTANGPQDLSNPDFGALTDLSNQYAAMPSLHIGWSLWCGVVIAVVTRRRWLRWAGMLYPLLTSSVVVGTANHYVLDAAGGALVVACGFALQYALTGPGRPALAAIPGARSGTCGVVREPEAARPPARLLSRP